MEKVKVKARMPENQDMKSRMTRFLVCAMVFLIASSGGYGPRSVEASPDEPVISDGGATVTLSGDQSQGITSYTINPDFATPPVTTVNVLDLTTDILSMNFLPAAIYFPVSGDHGDDGDDDPYNGDDGHDGSSSSDMTLNYDGGDFSISPAYTGEGIRIQNYGGNGGDGGQGNSGLAVTANGGDGGDGASSGVTTLNSSGTIQILAGAGAIYVENVGGIGGDGGAAKAGTAAAHGGDGGNGGAGNNIVVSSSSAIGYSNQLAVGITAYSEGRWGGDGGDGKTGSYGTGGTGGNGGAGGMVSVDNSGDISALEGGIFAKSASGAGGDGGLGGGTDGQGGDAGDAGAAGRVIVTNTGAIDILQGNGIDAESIGNTGGNGGEGDGVSGIAGDGGNGGNSGAVGVSNAGVISVQSSASYGIYALSEAGDGGNGGDGTGVSGIAGDGGIGGSGGTVSVTNQADITMLGAQSQGIMAASRGGAGGDGGQGDGVVGIGGAGQGSGPGGDVTVNNSGTIQTEEDFSRGIFIQSVGGYGGSSGSSGGFYAYSAGGNSGGDGGGVDLVNTASITTLGEDSDALFAQSVGGGGGSGGSSCGVITIGGSGDAGGNGGDVTVFNSGSLQTSQDEAGGIVAQSVGGGGGDGGATISGGLEFAVALGGSAGSGGDGGDVSVDSSHTIDTAGENAAGIMAQSVGGGGGNGGYSIAASAGGFDCSVTIGGSGGDGGQGGAVNVDNESAIHTEGENSYGILAESVGGGGGVAGYAVSASVSAISAAVSLGGSGGDGGDAQKVAVTSSGDIVTEGDNSSGILAQSVGGGGGAAGYSASGSLGVGASVAYSMGGNGGKGGDGGEVSVTNNNTISTFGSTSYGLLAQSVGGGGGAGAMSIGASANEISVAISLGADGGTGGDGGLVEVTNNGNITTAGEMGYGILAQSVGGGGGTAGFSLSEDVGILAMGFSWGGGGDGNAEGGGHGGVVNLNNSGDITTKNINSHGILAQSIGGGGGAGGFAETTALSFGVQTEDVTIPCMSLAVALGGAGGRGNSSQKVTVQNSGDILTYLEGSSGILAQSIGGGGGEAGWATAVAMSFVKGDDFAADISIAHGGVGGSGGDGGEVEVVNAGSIHTIKDDSTGISAQSIGGGGGNGGLSVAGTVEIGNKSASYQAAALIGGSGGDGGSGDTVTVTSSESIVTEGENSAGIDAQSIGGGGGNGGFSFSGDVSLRQSFEIGLSVGGFGGGGGAGGDVTVNVYGDAISTMGIGSPGVSAQSVGGGGGKGGSSLDVTLGNFGLIGETRSNANISLSVGGFGGDGDPGGSVTVRNMADSGTEDTPADISTQGDYSCGIYAQSVGGGGGDGGQSASMGLSAEALSNSQTKGLDIQLVASMGGNGGTGNHGGEVQVLNDGKIVTQGEASHGIYAQSVGGGGGTGGSSTIFNYVYPTKAPEGLKAGVTISLDATVGGFGGGSGDGGDVRIRNGGEIETYGNDASGLFVQSVGGGGGDGGNSLRIPGVPIPGGKAAKDYLLTLFNIKKWALQVGGSGGSSGKGGDIRVDNGGNITTWGSAVDQVEDEEEYTLEYNALGSHGIFAQSVGGGGGTGGNANIGFDFGRIGLSGTGGSGGDGGCVTVNNSGVITTVGDGSHGIWAQSVGGGGGVAGDIVRNIFNISNVNYFGLGLGIGTGGGDGGDGGAVTVESSEDIVTTGDDAFGIFAQSVGGGGGTGGIDTGYPEHLIFNGSIFAGSPGDGGAVSASQTGDVLTYGEHGHGIVAQSTSGSGAAGTVNVTLTGNVIAGGYASHGIMAQSLGVESCQNITVTINNGSTVQGGCDTGDCSPGGSTDYSFGVLFLDGTDNLLTNHGLITTNDGIGGTAVMQQASYGAPHRGDLTIDNCGTITGSVDQGDQSVSEDSDFIIEGMDLPTGISFILFNNNQEAVFNTGSTINLGFGLLSNRGTLNVGGGTAIQSELTGNFSQTPTGVFQTTLNPDGSCGSLTVSTKATLGGTLALSYGSGTFTAETTYRILTAGNIDGEFSQEVFPDDTLLSVSTEYNSTVVDVKVTPESVTTMAQNSHEMLLAQYHDRLLTLTDHEFSDVLAELQRLHASEFRSAFASFSPAIYDANIFTTFNVSRQYLRTVQERLRKERQNMSSGNTQLTASGDNTILLAANDFAAGLVSSGNDIGPSRKQWTVSVDGFGHFGDANEADGLSGFDYSMGGMAVDVEYAINEQAIVGAGLGYAHTNIDLDSDFGAGDMDSFFGSLHGTYFMESAYLEGVLTYAHHCYDNRRRISIGSIQNIAESDHDADSYSVLMEAGYNLLMGSWTLQPFANLLYTYLDEEGFQESGADSLDMHIRDNRTNDLNSELGARLSKTFWTPKGVLTPEFKAAWQYNYDVDRHFMQVSFTGEESGLDINGRKRSGSALFGVGLSYTSDSKITASLQYDGEIADDFTAYGILGQICVPF